MGSECFRATTLSSSLVDGNRQYLDLSTSWLPPASHLHHDCLANRTRVMATPVPLASECRGESGRGHSKHETHARILMTGGAKWDWLAVHARMTAVIDHASTWTHRQPAEAWGGEAVSQHERQGGFAFSSLPLSRPPYSPTMRSSLAILVFCAQSLLVSAHRDWWQINLPKCWSNCFSKTEDGCTSSACKSRRYKPYAFL
jgi:hypothetical protein